MNTNTINSLSNNTTSNNQLLAVKSGVKRVHSSHEMRRQKNRSPSCRRRSSDIMEGGAMKITLRTPGLKKKRISDDDESNSHPLAGSLSQHSARKASFLRRTRPVTALAIRMVADGDNGLLSTDSAVAELTKFTTIPDGLSDRKKLLEK
ncbi:hypothetical protein Btru_074816 [Bulinus truncatus]|nr:hypothetical protein Btru_074816 [Bulinus truncatus]